MPDGEERERQLRQKLEELLEVQTMQTQMQRELRAKTESLLDAERAKGRDLQQRLAAQGTGPDALRDAQARIRELEFLVERQSSSPETGDRDAHQIRLRLQAQAQRISELEQQRTGLEDLTRRDQENQELQARVQGLQAELASAAQEAQNWRDQARQQRHQVEEGAQQRQRLEAEVERHQQQVEALRQEALALKQVPQELLVEPPSVASVGQDRALAELRQQLGQQEDIRRQLAQDLSLRDERIVKQTAMIEELTRIAQKAQRDETGSPVDPEETEAVGIAESLRRQLRSKEVRVLQLQEKCAALSDVLEQRDRELADQEKRHDLRQQAWDKEQHRLRALQQEPAGPDPQLVAAEDKLEREKDVRRKLEDEVALLRQELSRSRQLAEGMRDDEDLRQLLREKDEHKRAQDLQLQRREKEISGLKQQIEALRRQPSPEPPKRERGPSPVRFESPERDPAELQRAHAKIEELVAKQEMLQSALVMAEREKEEALRAARERPERPDSAKERATPPLRPYPPDRPSSRQSRGGSRASFARPIEEDAARASPELSRADTPHSRADTPGRAPSRGAQDELLTKTQQVSRLQYAVREQEEIAMRYREEQDTLHEEIAQLRQQNQQAEKDKRKKEREVDKLTAEKDDCVRSLEALQTSLRLKDEKLVQLFVEQGTRDGLPPSMSAAGLRMHQMNPRQHEVRGTFFCVLSQSASRHTHPALAFYLAACVNVGCERVEVVEDARLPEQVQHVGLGDAPQQLVLCRFLETHQGTSACDLVDQLRDAILRGSNSITDLDVDALFFNHGDCVLPFEWPTAREQQLLREGRILAGKYTVVTVHEVQEPYILRIAVADTESGLDFTLHLAESEVLLLLDAHIAELARQEETQPAKRAKLGMSDYDLTQRFLDDQSASDPDILEVILKSLSFSLYHEMKILVASEMRVPDEKASEPKSLELAASARPTSRGTAIGQYTKPMSSVGQQLVPSRPNSQAGSVAGSKADVRSAAGSRLDKKAPSGPSRQTSRRGSRVSAPGAQTRYRRVAEEPDRLLHEEVLVFRSTHCVLQMTVTPDDTLNVRVHHPVTCRSVSAHLPFCLDEDRLRIVGEGGQLDPELSLVLVVEEIVYPPSFLVRMTTVDLDGLPEDEVRKCSHCIRMAKNLTSVVHLPDVSFALTPSFMRQKLLACLTVSTQVEAPKEIVASPIARTVTGHVHTRSGLKIQLLKPTRPDQLLDAQVEFSASKLPAGIRQQLRDKYGRGRTVKRIGTSLPCATPGGKSFLRVVLSVFERQQPYLHFVVSAYDPLTSREWEVLMDSIDLYRMRPNTGKAADLTNPATQNETANWLCTVVELDYRESELSLVFCAAVTQARSIDTVPAMARQVQQAVPDSAHAAYGSVEQIEAKLKDRLFVCQRTLRNEPFRIAIYDLPLVATLHSYLVVASPARAMIDDREDPSSPGAGRLARQTTKGSAAPSPSDLANAGFRSSHSHSVLTSSQTYSFHVVETALRDLVGRRTELLDPTRLEELLLMVTMHLRLDEDLHGDMRLRLAETSAAKEDTVSVATATALAKAGPGISDAHKRLVGGASLVRAANSQGENVALLEKQPPMAQWKHVYCMAQKFDGRLVLISIHKNEHHDLRVRVYDPESCANYDFLLTTNDTQQPYKVLLEYVELTPQLQLVCLIHEVCFPHAVAITLVHCGSGQEFNLKIGDDRVYSVLEGSRREAFSVFFDQMLRYGAAGIVGDVRSLESVFYSTNPATCVADMKRVGNAGVPVVRVHFTDNPLALRDSAKDVDLLPLKLVYFGEKVVEENVGDKDQGIPGPTLSFKVHKRTTTGDLAIRLRLLRPALSPAKAHEPRGELSHVPRKTTQGQYQMPSLGTAQGVVPDAGEYQLWYRDKRQVQGCAGCYGELCNVPGLARPLLVVVTDEEEPRAMRVLVAMATLPFEVLFSLCLLDQGERSAALTLASASVARRRMQKVFLQQFGGKMPMSAILSQMSHPSMTEKGEDDEKDQIMSKVGVSSGTGPGVVGHGTRGGQNPVETTMIHMCTRKKLGRMMIFSVYKDQIGQNIYLRVVMLDPVWHRETHLTVLGHATQSFLDHLRINRDMIEQHRAELGRLVVANTYLVNKPAEEDADLTNLEAIDEMELPDQDAREYVLRLQDVIATTNSYDLPSKRALLDTAHDVLREIGEKVDSRMSWETFDPNHVALAKRQIFSQGRHLQVAVYGDTNSTDMLSHSHNIRVKVADAESLQILQTRDLHEDVLEPLLAALGQRQLISATREQEMAELLLERILLQYDGYEVSGVQFSMPEGDAI